MQEKIDWIALLLTAILIVLVRESSVWIMEKFNHPELGNLAGLFFFLILLITWRKVSALPRRLIDANAKIMKESAFAFLPVSAGSVIMLATLGTELPAIVFILFFCTLIPLWLYAKMAKRWL